MGSAGPCECVSIADVFASRVLNTSEDDELTPVGAQTTFTDHPAQVLSNHTDMATAALLEKTWSDGFSLSYSKKPERGNNLTGTAGVLHLEDKEDERAI